MEVWIVVSMTTAAKKLRMGYAIICHLLWEQWALYCWIRRRFLWDDNKHAEIILARFPILQMLPRHLLMFYCCSGAISWWFACRHDEYSPSRHNNTVSEMPNPFIIAFAYPNTFYHPSSTCNFDQNTRREQWSIKQYYSPVGFFSSYYTLALTFYFWWRNGVTSIFNLKVYRVQDFKTHYFQISHNCIQHLIKSSIR